MWVSQRDIETVLINLDNVKKIEKSKSGLTEHSVNFLFSDSTMESWCFFDDRAARDNCIQQIAEAIRKGEKYIEF